MLGSKADGISACAGCHALLDPPGFALESFDQLGRRRDHENGKPIDSSGTTISAGDLDGAFARGEELLERFGRCHTVRRRFAQEYFQFALTGDAVRPVAEAYRCSHQRVGDAFAASGGLAGLSITERLRCIQSSFARGGWDNAMKVITRSACFDENHTSLVFTGDQRVDVKPGAASEVVIKGGRYVAANLFSYHATGGGGCTDAVGAGRAWGVWRAP